MAEEASETPTDAAALAARVEELTGELTSLREHLDHIDSQRRELDEFISLLAHDLRTPLTSIRGYSQLMLRGRREDSDPAIVSGLQTVIDQADRLSALTSLLLDVSRVRLGRVALRRMRVDLGSIVSAVLASFQGVAPATLDLPEHGPIVSADSTRLEQVVRALVDFATDRVKGGDGSEDRSYEISVSITGDMAVISVADDAPAMDSSETAQLFAQLVRPAPTATGWELGRPAFYILEGVVGAHGGRVTAESPAPGSTRGAKLSVWLPLHTERE